MDQRSGKVRPFAFRPCFIDPFQGTVAARFAVTDLKAKTGAILYDVGSDYGQWLAKYFEEAFVAKGGKIVAKEAFRSEELDYRAQLGKMKGLNPDVIFIPTSQKGRDGREHSPGSVASTPSRSERQAGEPRPDRPRRQRDRLRILRESPDLPTGQQDFRREYKAPSTRIRLQNPVMAQDPFS
jgi:hypothetical protein